MCLFRTALLLAVLDFISCAKFLARLNMGGVTGQVQFDSEKQTATLNVTGAGSCAAVSISLTVFPVMYGHFAQPCSEANIGVSVFTFTADPSSTSPINVSLLFDQKSNLDDLSLSLQTCDGIKVCTVASQDRTLLTRQARFTESVAGNIYIRTNVNNANPRLLADLVTIGQVNATETNIIIFGSTSTATNCKKLLKSLNPASLKNLECLCVSFSGPSLFRRGETEFSLYRGFIQCSTEQLIIPSQGDVSIQLLESVRSSELMGTFRKTGPCARNSAGQLVLLEIFSLCLMCAAAFLLPSAASL